MRIQGFLGLLAIVCLCGPSPGSSGPDNRPLTDPKSVVSPSNSAAGPAPVDDLYFTRRTFDAAWSPDGQEIVFTTDISGRFNLWKVRASGGWPIQLMQSDDRQYSAVWSPDGKWIVYQQDHEGEQGEQVWQARAGQAHLSTSHVTACPFALLGARASAAGPPWVTPPRRELAIGSPQASRYRAREWQVTVQSGSREKYLITHITGALPSG